MYSAGRQSKSRVKQWAPAAGLHQIQFRRRTRRLRLCLRQPGVFSGFLRQLTIHRRTRTRTRPDRPTQQGRNTTYARLGLSRDCQGEGWSLSKGTLLIGRVNGSENDRAYVNIVGFIDPKSNRFVKMNGEVLGSDGGAGIAGKRVAVDRNHLRQTLSKVASSGLQVAGMMAGALTGRGTVVVNGAGYRLLNPITDEAGRVVGNSDDKRSFVKVEAGQSAYVMVADLPKESRAVDAPGENELTRAATSLNDREVMELILLGSPEEIRAALPLMNEEQKQLVIKSIGMESQKP